MDNSIIVALKNIVVDFDGEPILTGLSLDIHDKEFVTLLGPSGCGKTTTLRVIGGFVEPRSGNVFFAGRDITRLPPYKRQVNTVFQKYALFPHLNVFENVAFGLRLQKLDEKEIRSRCLEMLELVGLVPEHATRYPHEFSGGQRQRIGVARSVIMNPELIIADEPVSALDVSVQAQVINLLNELREKFGLTILFIAHDLSVVKYFSDRIGVMYFGKMVEMASSDELFAHPLHPYTRSLLSAIPLPDPVYEKKRQRITYNPLAEHDYSVDKPSFREVAPGHFVQCNDAEFAKYQQELRK